MDRVLKQMIISLAGITFGSSFLVGIVNLITQGPIAKVKEEAKKVALELVLPPFSSSKMYSVDVAGESVDVYFAYDDSLKVVGYAAESQTKRGYSGRFSLMVGMSEDGTLHDVNVLSHSETPGLGSKMCDADNVLIRSVKGKSLDSLDFRVVKDGGDIDALSGATITSRAYGDALSIAHEARSLAIVEAENERLREEAEQARRAEEALQAEIERERAEAERLALEEESREMGIGGGVSLGVGIDGSVDVESFNNIEYVY